MMIFNQRNCNFPSRTYGYWWLSQFRRWGMVKSGVDYNGIVDKVIRPDIYLEAMKEIDVAPKITDVQRVTFGDGSTFDASDPEKYAKSFAIHSMS